jgi:hypothetical protein
VVQRGSTPIVIAALHDPARDACGRYAPVLAAPTQKQDMNLIWQRHACFGAAGFEFAEVLVQLYHVILAALSVQILLQRVFVFPPMAVAAMGNAVHHSCSGIGTRFGLKACNDKANIRVNFLPGDSDQVILGQIPRPAEVVRVVAASVETDFSLVHVSAQC